jgi:hypothetical protein
MYRKHNWTCFFLFLVTNLTYASDSKLEKKMVLNEGSCPVSIIKHIMEADLNSSENSTLFSWVAEKSTLACQVYSLGLIARRLDDSSDRQVLVDFCSSAATYAKFLTPQIVQDIKDAYLKFPYNESSSLSYFNGLRYNQIDIRSYLKGKIKEDWSFTYPRKKAQTWHYSLYLASLGDGPAYLALDKKLTSTTDGNDLTNLIINLATLKTVQVKEILLKYQQDLRRSDTPGGPGITVGESVLLLIEKW